VILDAVIIVVALATLALAVRLVLGPTALDRVVAFDAITINIIVLVVLTALRLQTTVFLNVAILVAILGFIGTVAMAQYVGGGIIIDREGVGDVGGERRSRS
jgi:multisubunit Na+/H+ antiporter MnhF subunit